MSRIMIEDGAWRNIELGRDEFSKLENMLRTMIERNKALQQAVKEVIESLMPERNYCQHEVDCIKEAIGQRNIARRRNMARIAKPIRGGQPRVGSGNQGIRPNQFQSPG